MDSLLGKRDRSGGSDWDGAKRGRGRDFGDISMDLEDAEVLQPVIGYPRPIPHALIDQQTIDDFILRVLELGAALRKKDVQITCQFFSLLDAEQIKQTTFKIDKLKAATLKKCRGDWGLFLASKHQKYLPSLQSFAITCIAEGRSVLSVA